MHTDVLLLITGASATFCSHVLVMAIVYLFWFLGSGHWQIALLELDTQADESLAAGGRLWRPHSNHGRTPTPCSASQPASTVWWPLPGRLVDTDARGAEHPMIMRVVYLAALTRRAS